MDGQILNLLNRGCRDVKRTPITDVLCEIHIGKVLFTLLWKWFQKVFRPETPGAVCGRVWQTA